MDALFIENIQVPCIIGDLPQERERETVLRVDAEIRCDTRAAALADDLQYAVDYAAAARRIAAALREAKCRLLECAAEIAARECLADPRVESVRVRVRKAGAVEGVEAAAVEVERP